jgi:hypothetical protein
MKDVVKLYKKEIRILIVMWGVFLVGIITFLAVYTVSRVRNDYAWTKAQIQNIGKPIIYEQYYHSPQDL